MKCPVYIPSLSLFDKNKLAFSLKSNPHVHYKPSLRSYLTEASDEQPIAHRQYMACQTFAAGESFQTHFTFAPAVRMMVNFLVIW